MKMNLCTQQRDKCIRVQVTRLCLNKVEVPSNKYSRCKVAPGQGLSRFFNCKLKTVRYSI